MNNNMNFKVLCGCVFFCFFHLLGFSQEIKLSKLKSELVFQSGFEGTSKIVTDSTAKDLETFKDHFIGIDNTLRTKNNWVKDLDESPLAGRFSIQYTGGDYSKRYACIIPEPGNPKNNVLAFWLNDSWMADGNKEKARIQANFFGIKTGYKAFYQTVRVYLHPDFEALRNYPKPIKWCTISEFWNDEPWVNNKMGFRITLGIGKQTEGEGDLGFILSAEDINNNGKYGAWINVWDADSYGKVKVPVGKWFTMDYYYKEGNDKTGRFYMNITPDGGKKQTVFDITNFTHHTQDPAPAGITGINPLKLYTSKELVAFMKAQGKTLQIYWDDFKIWKIND